MRNSSKYPLVTAVVYIACLLHRTSGSLPSNSSSPAVPNQQQQCPTWFFWNATSRECDCKGSKHIVYCSQAKYQTWLNRRYCMTYDNRTDSTTVGQCPYGDLMAKHKKVHHILLPENRTKLNEAMCGNAHREGLLCSRCKPGYGPSPLSYDHRCVKCSNSFFGWLLYFCTALIPPTVFFFCIVICQVRTTSAPLNFFVFACQIATVCIGESSSRFRYYSKPFKLIYSTGTTLLTSWNLDYFRLLIPPFCVSESLSNLQVLSMDYIVAFYPLLLTVVMYICIQQHARGCRLLVCLWKPFAYCLGPLARRFNWNPATSVVPVFSSFLLLTSTKILTVSFSLLQCGQQVTHLSSVGIKTNYRGLLYYDANLIFFSQDHLPYAITAIFVSSTFVILPCLVLILYPTQLFQKFLNWCGIGCHAVHAFAHTFSGCYKNGTNGTRDYRCFAVFFIFAYYATMQTQSLIQKLASIVIVVIFALASPYRNRLFNCIDSLSLILLTCRVCIHEYEPIFNAILEVYVILHFAVFVSFKVMFKLNCHCFQNLKALVDRMSGLRKTPGQLTERQEVTDQLPDRVVNPNGYRRLTEVDEPTQVFSSNIPTYGSIHDVPV